MSGPYDDIIDLPHHTSQTRPRMPIANRAAQFASFAALSGYDESIAETARYTQRRQELDEHAIEVLDKKLNTLEEHFAEHPEIAVTHFRADTKKDGGVYVVTSGSLKKLDEYEHTIVLMNGEAILIKDILDIECELFKQ